MPHAPLLHAAIVALTLGVFTAHLLTPLRIAVLGPGQMARVLAAWAAV